MKRNISAAEERIPSQRSARPEIPVFTRRERDRLAALDENIADLEKHAANAELQARLATLVSERDTLMKGQRLVMVTRSVTPRTVRVLPRGNWLDDSGPVVEPAVPAFLGKLQVNGRGSRLDLANWLTDSKDGVGGLTARVFVNRLWYLYFGAGLSRSLEDFGGQGEPPLHPELLDNLAVEFVDSGWDIKHMVKLIVMSRTYRQLSAESVKLKERDPGNRLLARQGSWRLPAEMIRDNALFVSGLLISDVGGPSAKPYQPAGFYRHLNFPKREYAADSDAKQWRRGVYIHWQRQYLHPMLKAFDASTREECAAQRARSNTPLAALVLLNDPTFIEAARVFAQRLLEYRLTDPERISEGFRLATGREPNPTETTLLRKLLERNRALYKEDPAAAEKLVKIGIAPAPQDPDYPELASWTAVCRALLNLSESITRE